jgi:hypothetical protein
VFFWFIAFHDWNKETGDKKESSGKWKKEEEKLINFYTKSHLLTQ